MQPCGHPTNDVAVIRVQSNIKVVSAALLSKLSILRDPRPLLRPVALDVLQMMTARIHEEGLAADGAPIGSYKNNYLRLRMANNRGKGRKIIVSLTRQLENDWSVLPTSLGWGIGFKNPYNAHKLRWVEAQKGKKIGALTKEEKAYALTKLRKLLAQKLN